MQSGTEMMPFSNIFNEWYAAQTSKKIRAVNQMKAAKGQRVSSSVPYGYMKNPNDKQKWLIDEPAAEIVRKIFNLCLAGKGPSQIARQLEKEKILTPTAYYYSIGKKTSNPMPGNVYGWRENSIDHILENRQYTGCTVNGKSTTVSYKIHKVIERPKEEYQIVPDTQEAIISENIWLRVQITKTAEAVVPFTLYEMLYLKRLSKTLCRSLRILSVVMSLYFSIYRYKNTVNLKRIR